MALSPQSPLHSALASPRSSTSSAAPSLPPLTPLYELDKAVEEMAIASSSGSSDFSDEDVSPAATSKPTRIVPRSQASSTTPHAGPSSPRPSTAFSFGTCPSIPLASTPTSELGQFDYPLPVPSRGPLSPRLDPTRRESLALGQTYRRGSIIARPSHTEMPSPPATRRSSTCSTITTLPLAGRRPSILHSASTNSGPIPNPMSQASSPAHSRRPSILFPPPKAQHVPIPPSLLARRGSLPAAQLFGIPSADMGRARASFGGHPSYTTTTAQLYQRRESILSEDGSSAGSSQTIGPTSTSSKVVSRRSSLRHDIPIESHTPRRSSMPAPVHLISPNRLPASPLSPQFTERRARLSSAGTTRSGLGSSLSSSEEEDEDPLPTPSTASLVGFSDPWRTSDEKGGGFGMTRPPLESIPSDDTERGY